MGISARFLLPYLMAITLLAGGGTFLIVRFIASSLDEELVNQLIRSLHETNYTASIIEKDQLEALRGVSFAEGVGLALGQGDLVSLKSAIRRAQLIRQVPRVEVLDREGAHILSLKIGERDVAELEPEPGISGWTIVRKVLNGESDELGDTFADLISTASGSILYVAGPVHYEGDLVGALLVGTPMADVAALLTQRSQAAVTFYDTSGAVLASTLLHPSVYADIALSSEGFRQLPELSAPRGSALRRSLKIGQLGYDELVGALELRGIPVAAMGVAVSSDNTALAQRRFRDLFIAAFGVIAALVLLLGMALTRMVAYPILALRQEVEVFTRDAHHMLETLREQEHFKGEALSTDMPGSVEYANRTPRGERRKISIMAIGVWNFAGLSQGLGSEQLVALVSRLFVETAECIEKNGGKVNRYLGEGIIASFEANYRGVDHPERAVRSALMVREVLAKLSQDQEKSSGEPLRAGIGVHTGEVLLVDIGLEEHREHTIVGEAVGIAQRIQHLSGDFAWDILISASTFRDVRNLVLVAEPQAARVMTRRRTSQIYPLLGLKKVGSPANSAPVDATTSSGDVDKVLEQGNATTRRRRGG